MPTRLAQLASSVKKTQRRRVRALSTRDNLATAKIYSLTIPGRVVDHEVAFDFAKGIARCSCDDFKYHRNKPGYACKHVVRFFAALERKMKEAV